MTTLAIAVARADSNRLDVERIMNSCLSYTDRLNLILVLSYQREL